MKALAGLLLVGLLASAAMVDRDAIAAAPASPAQASPPGDDASLPPAALAQVSTGLWELRSLSGGKDPPRRICVSDVRLLLQPLNAASVCRQYVSEATPDRVTATYDCAGKGQGRTALRIETPRLVQIDSQGISDGRPFGARLEGRHVGTCPEIGDGRPAR